MALNLKLVLIVISVLCTWFAAADGSRLQRNRRRTHSVLTNNQKKRFLSLVFKRSVRTEVIPDSEIRNLFKRDVSYHSSQAIEGDQQQLEHFGRVRNRRDDDIISKSDKDRKEYERRLFESLHIIGSIQATHIFVREDPELVPVGTVIGKVRKLYPHGKVLIVWPYEGFRNFTLNEDTGEITTTALMNFEFIRLYNMTIRDFQYNYTNEEKNEQPPMPSPPGSEYVDHYLMVEVIDINDNDPQFVRDTGQQGQFIGYVNQNARAGTKILKLRPTDDDSGPRGRIRYLIITKDNEETPFTIDPRTFWLKTNGKALETKTYQVNIQAMDYGMPPRVSKIQDVAVEVKKDLPYFVDGVTQVHNFSEASARGSVIAEIIALSRSGIPVGYEIEDEEAKKIFAINQLGQVTLLKQLDYDNTNVTRIYEFVVKATEVGDEGQANRAKVTLQLTNADDHLGMFKTPATKIRIKEGVKAQGDDLYTVEVIDCDCKENCKCGSSEMIFTLGNTSGFFDITKDGQIRNIKELDYETQNYFSFAVNVTDPGTNGRTRTSYIEIIVEDDDDTAPKFPFNEYIFSIFEDAPKDQVVGVAQAVDPDPSTKPNDVQYSVASADPVDGRKYFEVANQGVIKVVENRNNFGTFDEYQFTIKATDKQNKVSVPPATVIINILDVNDHPPVFKECKSQKLKENQPIGTLVTQLVATDQDRGLNKLITYGIQPVQKHNFFAIDADNGKVTTKEVLDREQYESVFVIAKATDGGPTRSDALRQIGYCQFVVEVLDVNDHYPMFTVETFEVTIKQNLAVDDTVLYVKAVDPDVGKNAKVIYKIETQKVKDKDVDYFKIDKDSGKISVKQPLKDVALLDKVEVKVQADNTVPFVDGVRKTPESMTTVIVSFTTETVVQFSKPQFVVNNVKESVATNTPIFKLSMKTSGNYLYSLQKQIRNRDNLPFHVDAATGQIRTTKTLDFEQKKSYLFAVIARKSVNDADASAIVEVNIEDVDDVVPIFGNDKYEATISEAVGADANVFRIKATDSDPQGGGPIKYIIQSNYDNKYFDVEAVGDFAQIKTASGLPKNFFDREKQDVYNIIIEAYRTSNADLKSTAAVTIHVRDENDSPPVFKKKLYEASVAEGTPQPIPFTVKGIKVEATDDDVLENANISYFITSGNDGRFEMKTVYDKDQKNYGELRVVLPLDVEKTLDFSKNPVYNLTITATDRKHTATAYVVIKVLDRAENKPEFLREYYEKYLPENVGPGVTVVQVQVRLPESIVYELGSDIAKRFFTINQQNGLITTAGELLDWETDPVITFPVIAYDTRNPYEKGQTYVRVKVNDVNDAPPIFPDQPYIGYVGENEPAGTRVRYINGKDLDNPDLNDGKNVKLSYELLTNTGRDPYDKDGKLFRFNSEGLLTARISFDLEKYRRNLTLRVRAWDHGNPRLYGETDVTIVIIDFNEDPVLFRKDKYFASVSETQPPGYVVLQLTVVDYDFSSPNNNAFSMMDGNDPYAFDIIQETGEIVVSGVLDYEATNKRQYKLTVGLMERDRQFLVNSSILNVKVPFQDTATVTIDILAGNDHRPSFTKKNKIYLTSISEDIKVGTHLNVSIEAKDEDVAYSNEFAFRFTKGNIGDWFGIKKDPADSNKAIVFVQNPIDREYKASYELELIVKDNAGAYDTAKMIVTVTDINDNPPVFHPSYYEGIIDEEGCSSTEPIATLRVTDPDKPEQGPFTFAFATGGNPGGKFELRERTDDTVKLYCIGSVNREDTPNPVVIVRATDNVVPKQSSIAKVFIKVRDKDEYSSGSARLSIIVNAIDGNFGGGPIGRTYFDDDDGDEDQGIVNMDYALTSGSDEFVVRKDDGLITAKSTVKIGRYELKIQGRKGGSRPQCTVDVNIRNLPQDAILNSAAVQLDNVRNPGVFMNPITTGSNSLGVETYYNKFIDMLMDIYNVGNEDVFVFSVQTSAMVVDPGRLEPAIDVRFAIRKDSSARGDFLPREVLINELEKNNNTLKDLGFKIGMIGIDYCVNETLRIGRCNNIVQVNNEQKYEIVSSEYGLLPSPNFAVSIVSINTIVDGAYDRYRQDPDPEYDECDPGPKCLNGGTCHDVKPHGFVCECPGEYSGPRCQMTTRTFKGNSYIWLPPKTPYNYGKISFEFATNDANGLLLYQGPAVEGGNNGHGDFFAISLVKGKIRVGISFGGKPLKFTMDKGPRLDNGKWHHVELAHSRKDLILTIDHCMHADIVEDDERIVELRQGCEMITRTHGNFEYMNGLGPLQVGGIENMPLDYPPSDYIEYAYYYGCIRKITENLEMYDLAYPVKVVNAPSGCTIMAPCPICKNNGYCYPGFSRSVCSCQMGFVGDDCSGKAPRFNYLPGSFTEYKLPGEERRRKRDTKTEPGNLLDRYAMHIAMQLRIDPEVEKATFFYAASEQELEYSLLAYEEQKLYFEFKLLDGLQRLEMPGEVKVADGVWHNITVSREGNLAVLQVDYSGRVSRNTGGLKKLIRMSGAKLYAGGLPNIAPNATIINKTVEALITDIRYRRRRRSAGTILGVTTDGREVSAVDGDMTGCTGGSSYNGKNLDTDPNVKKTRFNVESGCPCRAVFQCRNGGYCVDADIPYCQCSAGWTGLTCEEIVYIAPVLGYRVDGRARWEDGGILVVILCVLLAVLIIAIALLFVKKRREAPHSIPVGDEGQDSIMPYHDDGAGEEDTFNYDIHHLMKYSYRDGHGVVTKEVNGKDRPVEEMELLNQEADMGLSSAIGVGGGGRMGGVGAGKAGQYGAGGMMVQDVDIWPFILERVKRADEDISWWPQDEMVHWADEGDDEEEADLSEIGESDDDEKDVEQDWDFLKDWGRKFENLNKIFNPDDDDDDETEA